MVEATLSNADVYDMGANDWFVLESDGRTWLYTDWDQTFDGRHHLGDELYRVLAAHEEWGREPSNKLRKTMVPRHNLRTLADELESAEMTKPEAVERLRELGRR